MIRLIVSDVDGTLLAEGQKELQREFVDRANAIQDAGILFAAASGRQYPNLKRLFRDLKQDILYICENGALAVYQNKVLFKQPILREMGMELMADIWEQSGCEVLLSGKTTSYIFPKRMRFYQYMEEVVGNHCTLIEHPNQVEEAFLKISAYCEDGIEPYADALTAKWESRLRTAVSGSRWLDFNSRTAGKGAALRRIRQQFDISYEDTMVFGDNFNDLDMFEQGYFSYAMLHADSDIRAQARYVTQDVASILQDVLYMNER